MRIVSLRSVHLRVRICPLRWGTVRRASHNWFAVRFETVVEKTAYGAGCSADNWGIFAKVLRKSEVL